MKRILIFPFLILLSSFLILFWWYKATQSPSTDKVLYPFVITRGMAADQIAQKLEKEGFIRSSIAFRFYVQLTDKASSIQAGDYRLSKNLPLPALVKELVGGPIAVWITLPEGLRREEIGIKVLEELGITGNSRQDFLREFMRLTAGQEGYLFPDTYLFFKNVTAAVIVNRLIGTFEKRVDITIREQASQEKLSLQELVTLASIVERETRTQEERPIVAGILLKRLRVGWPLQADATVQYAVASAKCPVNGVQSVKCEWWASVEAGDKKINSPYNTYLRLGLPLGPIANSGLSSIAAVANPQDSPYWFYLHDKAGNIHYAKTSLEHQENIRKYLQ